jgi:hypothetical protein
MDPYLIACMASSGKTSGSEGFRSVCHEEAVCACNTEFNHRSGYVRTILEGLCTCTKEGTVTIPYLGLL